MDGHAKLIEAAAALVGTIAWPIAFLIGLLTFKKPIKAVLERIPALFDRLKSVEIGGVRAEIERISEISATDPAAKEGNITQSEIDAAVRIRGETEQIGEHAIALEMDKLSVEYDTIRRIMPPSDARTRAMTQILVQMRMLGPSVSDRISAYKSSGSAGSRLAAIAMMQIQPEKADLKWLLRRFKEDVPFIFYHAALALQNVADRFPAKIEQVQTAAKEALSVVQSFDGKPDTQTIFVLEALLSGKNSGHYV